MKMLIQLESTAIIKRFNRGLHMKRTVQNNFPEHFPSGVLHDNASGKKSLFGFEVHIQILIAFWVKVCNFKTTVNALNMTVNLMFA